MKGIKWLVIVALALAMVAVMGVTSVTAQATKTVCEGTIDAFWIVEWGESIETGNRLHVRGRVLGAAVGGCSDPRLNGLVTQTIDASYAPDEDSVGGWGKGRVRGTMRMDPDDGNGDGWWEGNYVYETVYPGTIVWDQLSMFRGKGTLTGLVLSVEHVPCATCPLGVKRIVTLYDPHGE